MADMKRIRIGNRKRIIREETEDIFCFCASRETRIEDFTHRGLGQELMRQVEVYFCPDCKEKYINGSAVIQMEAEIKAKVLALANKRVELPKGHKYLSYLKEKDLLEVNYNNYESIRREEDLENDIVYHFDACGILARIEVLNFYGNSVAIET